MFFLMSRNAARENAARENADGVGYAFIVCYDLTTNSVFYSTCTRGGAKQSLRTIVDTTLLENTSTME